AMVDVNSLRADHIWNQYSVQFSHAKDELFKNAQHSWFLSPVFLYSLAGFVVSLFIFRKILILIKVLKEPSVLLEVTPPAFTEKTSYTTQQLFSVLHNLGERRTISDKLLGRKTVFSFEIASSLNQGIRYLIRTTPDETNNVQKTLLSYL